MFHLIVGLALIPIALVGIYLAAVIFVRVILPLMLIVAMLGLLAWGGYAAYSASHQPSKYGPAPGPKATIAAAAKPETPKLAPVKPRKVKALPVVGKSAAGHEGRMTVVCGGAGCYNVAF